MYIVVQCLYKRIHMCHTLCNRSHLGATMAGRIHYIIHVSIIIIIIYYYL